MFKGITPTFILTLPEDIHLGNAENVIVTFSNSNGKRLLQKELSDLEIDDNKVSVFLTQEETLSFPTGYVHIQINWTYMDEDIIKRACSDIVATYWKSNLLNGVMA